MIDSHCHFDFDEFADSRSEIWRRCETLGLTGLHIPGVSPEQWPRAHLLCESQSVFHYSAGLHPWFIEQYFSKYCEESAKSFKEAVRAELLKSNCVAVGECGLDKLHANKYGVDSEFVWALQLRVLRLHFELAHELKRPIILHSVKAHAETLALIKEFGLTSGGVVHAFSGSAELAKQYVQHGFFLGVGGTITYERALKTREAMRAVPLENLLLETDAPSMPLAGKQGQVNSPEYLPEIARCLAELKACSIEDVIHQTAQNYQSLMFGV